MGRKKGEEEKEAAALRRCAAHSGQRMLLCSPHCASAVSTATGAKVAAWRCQLAPLYITVLRGWMSPNPLASSHPLQAPPSALLGS